MLLFPWFSDNFTYILQMKTLIIKDDTYEI